MRGLFNLDGPVMSALSKMCDLLWINVLTIICCIPIVTAGAAFSSLYYVTMKMAKNEEGYITRMYFDAFKTNFKKATIEWLIILAIGFLFYMDYRIFFYANLGIPTFFIILFLIILLICTFTSVFVFPLQARFENTIKRTFFNAFLLGMTQFPKAVLIVVLYALPVVLLLIYPMSFPLVIMFGIAVPAYFASLLFVRIFKKIEDVKNEAEGIEEEGIEVDPDSWTLPPIEEGDYENNSEDLNK